MRESRLFKIIYYLLDRGKATAPELAEKFEVSVRTVYRDIDALSGAGIPVYTEAGRNGGIHLLKDFVLDKALLSLEEKQEVLSALQSLCAAQNVRSSDTLSKLSALWGVSSENWLEVDFSRWGNGQRDNEKFELLKTAVIQHKSVKIVYANSGGIVSERTVWPLKLLYKSMAWYLKAYCTGKQDYRVFKLTRILDWEILDWVFDIQHFSAGEPEKATPVCTQVKLRFPREMAYRVYDEFEGAEVRQQENGDYIVSVQMPEDEWLMGFLLSFGTRVEIMEPAYLKKALARQAKLIYEKNKP